LNPLFAVGGRVDGGLDPVFTIGEGVDGGWVVAVEDPVFLVEGRVVTVAIVGKFVVEGGVVTIETIVGQVEWSSVGGRVDGGLDPVFTIGEGVDGGWVVTVAIVGKFVVEGGVVTVAIVGKFVVEGRVVTVETIVGQVE